MSSSAKYGKVSEIPSVNVCMNCHKGIAEYKGKYIEEGKDRAFYTAEIKKIYEAAGWDEGSQSYTGKNQAYRMGENSQYARFCLL